MFGCLIPIKISRNPIKKFQNEDFVQEKLYFCKLIARKMKHSLEISNKSVASKQASKQASKRIIL